MPGDATGSRFPGHLVWNQCPYFMVVHLISTITYSYCFDNSYIWTSVVGVPFPRNFITIAKTILKRLFRVYAHIYHAHFDDVITLQEEAHLNTSFKHFIYFVHEFNLIEKRELSPMQELIDRMMKWLGEDYLYVSIFTLVIIPMYVWYQYKEVWLHCFILLCLSVVAFFCTEHNYFYLAKQCVT